MVYRQEDLVAVVEEVHQVQRVAFEGVSVRCEALGFQPCQASGGDVGVGVASAGSVGVT